jgi:hypothetical protein
MKVKMSKQMTVTTTMESKTNEKVLHKSDLGLLEPPSCWELSKCWFSDFIELVLVSYTIGFYRNVLTKNQMKPWKRFITYMILLPLQSLQKDEGMITDIFDSISL